MLDLPELMRKLRFSTKFWHQEIRWNYGILRSVSSGVMNNITNIAINGAATQKSKN